MKNKITKEEYYSQNEETINQLLDIFELENLTFDEKIALLLPLIDSTIDKFFTPPLLKMPNEISSRVELHYHSRILLVLLKYILESNSKLDYLKNIDKQNKELISQNEQIIEQNNKTVEQNQQIIDLLKEIKDK